MYCVHGIAIDRPGLDSALAARGLDLIRHEHLAAVDPGNGILLMDAPLPADAAARSMGPIALLVAPADDRAVIAALDAGAD
ncbi:hypothetical protein ACLB0R_07325 [Sphingomonas sp. GlSt437]